MTLTAEHTYQALLLVQAAHLIHHRLAKRHVSWVEGIAAAVLCVPPTVSLPPSLLMGSHISLIGIQVIGSLWIRRFLRSGKKRGRR